MESSLKAGLRRKMSWKMDAIFPGSLLYCSIGMEGIEEEEEKLISSYLLSLNVFYRSVSELLQ